MVLYRRRGMKKTANKLELKVLSQERKVEKRSKYFAGQFEFREEIDPSFPFPDKLLICIAGRIIQN